MMENAEAIEIDGQDIELIREYVRLIREAADLFDRREQATPPHPGNNEDAPDVFNFLSDPHAFLDRVRRVCNVIMEFLYPPVIAATVVAVGQNRDVIVGLIQRFAEVLGGTSFLFGITALICGSDSRILRQTVSGRFKFDVEAVDEQIEQLETDVNSVSFRVNQLAGKIENLLQNGTRPTADDLREIETTIDAIKADVELCQSRMKLSQCLLDALKVKIEEFQNHVNRNNSAVVVGTAIASGVLYCRQWIGRGAAVATAVAGCIPLWFATCRLIPDLHDMSTEIQTRADCFNQLNADLETVTGRLREIQAQPSWYHHGVG